MVVAKETGTAVMVALAVSVVASDWVASDWVASDVVANSAEAVVVVVLLLLPRLVVWVATAMNY